MYRRDLKIRDNCGSRGIILLVTLVLLVVLSTLGYTLTARIAAQRHRDLYIIDYSKARYSCDSAVKYALATLEELEPKLVDRPNEPDFSDVFALTEEQYRELLAQVMEGMEFAEAEAEAEAEAGMIDLMNTMGVGDSNDANSFIDLLSTDDEYYEQEPPDIRGPYGPPWPYVTEAAEFEIGSAKVTIEIEDENAKYPLGWALIEDEDIRLEARAGFDTFCEWMGMPLEQVDSLKEQLGLVAEIKPFKVKFKPMTRTVRTPVTTPTTSRGRTAVSRTPRTRIVRKTVPASQQMAEQAAYFAKLFHSSLIDTETLARPIVESDIRKESVLKYMGTWASGKVNINTAPRHVLEAAFTFGGKADRIAEAIIQRRRIKPFEDMEELKRELYAFSNSIDKCESYITMTSRCFTIRVTAVSGVAKASSIIAITKDGKKVKRIAVVNT